MIYNDCNVWFMSQHIIVYKLVLKYSSASSAYSIKQAILSVFFVIQRALKCTIIVFALLYINYSLLSFYNTVHYI